MKLNVTQKGIESIMNMMEIQSEGESSSKLLFNKIVYGNGEDAGVNAEQLTNPIESAVISINAIDRSGEFVTLTGVLNNNDVEAGFRAKEVGIFIEDPDDENRSILFAYGYVDDSQAMYIPSVKEWLFETTENFMVYVGATENVSAVLTESLATVSKAEFNEHVSNVDNPHKVTKKHIGLENVPNVTTNDQKPTFTETTGLAKLISGEKLSVLLGKIAGAINILSQHRSDKTNPHGVTLSQIGAAASSHKHSTNDLTSGTLGISRGGTGVTSYSSLRSKLGLGSDTGVLAVSYGGTGVQNLTSNDYTTSRVRCISLQISIPDTISNGHIVCVYS